MTKQVFLDSHYGDLGHLSSGVFQTAWTAKIKPLLTRYLEHRKKRRALEELRSVDPRTLKDMGIDRSEVTSIVYGPPKGRRRNRAENNIVAQGRRWCDSCQ